MLLMSGLVHKFFFKTEGIHVFINFSFAQRESKQAILSTNYINFIWGMLFI